MKTTIKRKPVVKKNAKQNERHVKTSVIIPEGERKRIDTGLIDFSPFNKRRFFNQKALEELAADIAVHDLIHDITVRLKEDGRYELIVGERRLRAARIAKLKTLPAKIVVLSDALAKEIIFSENVHRENKHPLDEALNIADMQEEGKSTKEIALRLCKSESFVLGRAKLLSLIEPFQEIFVAGKMTLQEALQLATIAAESQQEFFDDNCTGWQDEDFSLGELSYEMRRYTYDLTKAPFDINDRKLVPEAGACSRCPFNTATMSTLFPEEAEHAICTNRTCYHNKCGMHYQLQLAGTFAEKPNALVLSPNISETLKNAIKAFPLSTELPVYNRYNVNIVQPPQPPDKKDYTEDNEDGSESYFDETAFEQAVQEYENDLYEYNQMIEKGTLIKGLLITPAEAGIVYFLDGKYTESPTAPKQTAKAVQEAMKAGVATPEMLQVEIERLQGKEERAKELDREKVQLKVHEQFETHVSKSANDCVLTDVDHVAARLIVYQSLGYSERKKVDAVLLIGNDIKEAALFEKLANLNECQYSYLIRMAIAGKSESKFPNNITGYTLYKTAEAAGINVQSIEAPQKQKATERENICNERIKNLEARIEELKKEAA